MFDRRLAQFFDWGLLGIVVLIGGVSLVTRRSRLSSDTAIGLLFVAMLALGVVIISASDAFQGDLLAILFGQILGTSWEQVAIMAAATGSFHGAPPGAWWR